MVPECHANDKGLTIIPRQVTAYVHLQQCESRKDATKSAVASLEGVSDHHRARVCSCASLQLFALSNEATVACESWRTRAWVCNRRIACMLGLWRVATSLSLMHLPIATVDLTCRFVRDTGGFWSIKMDVEFCPESLHII